MKLTPKQRAEVFGKSKGFCWYCGEKLKKGWHVDHVKPIIRDFDYVRKKGALISKIVQNGKVHRPENDNLTNCVPACAPCNLFKCVFSVEEFRKEIEEQNNRAERTSVNFRTSKRFGLLETLRIPVVFHFEREGLKQ